MSVVKTRRDFYTGTAVQRTTYAGQLHAGVEWLESDTGSIYRYDGDSWTQIESGGARLVVQSIPGTLKTYILDPDDGDAANADAERINDVTGFKAFRVTPITPGAATGLLAIIFGWSTSAGDLTAVNTAMSAVDVDVTTPGSAGQANFGAYALFPINATAASNTQLGFTESPWIIAESDTIKTIAVRSSGVDYTKGVRVEVIV